MNEWSEGKGGTRSTMTNGNIFDASPLAKFSKPIVAPAKYYTGNDDVYSSAYVMDYITLPSGNVHVLTGFRYQTIKTIGLPLRYQDNRKNDVKRANIFLRWGLYIGYLQIFLLYGAY